MSKTEKTLSLAGREFILLGTAHISQESIVQVVESIKREKPDCVAIELDSERMAALKNPESWRNLDIIKVLKNGQGFLMLANIILSSFQRRLGADVGVKPGEEMKAAAAAAEEMNIPAVMADRPIKITLRRAWARNSLWGKCKLLASLLVSAFDKEEISAEQIEELKTSSEMDSMMAELSEYLPKVKEVLIDERDRFLASRIWTASGNKVLAVLGAGHLNGVASVLSSLASGAVSADTSDIDSVPPKKNFSKILSWLIPAVIVLLIAAGFYIGGKEKGTQMIGGWFLWNSLLAALGTVLGGGHPLAVAAAALSAPFTSLCPVVGVGMVSGFVQAVLRKPQVRDMESVHDDILSLKGIYRNRILRIFAVFLFSSIGSSIATFAAGASFLGVIGQAFSRIAENLAAFFR